MEFYERLSKIRKVNKLTQAEVAHRSGMAIRTYQNYESGMRTPRTDVIEKLCNVFEIDNAVLFDNQKCIEYLKTKMPKNSIDKKTNNRKDLKNKIFKDSFVVSLPFLVRRSTLSSVIVAATIPYLAAGIGTHAYEIINKKKDKEESLQEKRNTLREELETITDIISNIDSNDNILQNKYIELNAVVNDESVKEEDYKLFIQLNKLVISSSNYKILLLNKKALCEKAIKLLGDINFQVDLYNNYYKTITLIGRDQDIIVDKINNELKSLKNKGLFDEIMEFD